MVIAATGCSWDAMSSGMPQACPSAFSAPMTKVPPAGMTTSSGQDSQSLMMTGSAEA